MQMISRTAAVAATLLTVAFGCGDNAKPQAPVDAMPDALNLVERGQYITNVLAACTFCHTPLLENGQRDLTRLFAGVDCFFDADPVDTNAGCLSSRNLTNHATGLANVTDQQIKDAFQNGIRTDGMKLAPVMPYWVFHNMTDEDANAVVAYLRSLPGVDHTVQANQPPWSMYNDGTIPAVAVINPATDIPLPLTGTADANAMRGRYLTAMAGLCMDCHTPEVAPPNYPLDFTKSFGGGRVFPKEALGLIDASYPAWIATRNLTTHATGLGGWTPQQIKLAIAEGRDRDNNAVCAATHGGAISPYAALTQQDLDDIVQYIANLPPVENDTAAQTCPPPVSGPCGNCAGPPVP
jgi:mono/diheme cytochrome c family protein